MPKLRFSRRLRNKLNNSKEIEVPRYPHQQLDSNFLAKNHRQVLAQKASKDAKPEGLSQTVKKKGQCKKPNDTKEKMKTPNCTERPITIQILQQQSRRRRKQKIGKITPAEKKILKTRITSKIPSWFGSSRTNHVIKLAPNRVTKKDVPRLISLRLEQSLKLVRRPKFYVGNFVRRAKTDIPFRKGY